MKGTKAVCFTTMLCLSSFMLSVAPAQSVALPLAMHITRLKNNAIDQQFRVEIENVSDQAIILDMGIMLGNGKMQYVTAVHLILVDSAGVALPLELIGPATVAGRIDALTVPLPARATFSFPVDLRSYACRKKDVWKVTLPPGHYHLSAEYAGVSVPTLCLLPLWIGQVHSSAISFTVPR
jgi:hypothetical protein